MSELQRLRDRVEQLEELLGMGQTDVQLIARALRLRPTQARTLGILLKQPMVTKDAMYFALYGDRPESDMPEGEATLRQHIRRIRKSLPDGVELTAIYGQGWMIPSDHKTKVWAAIDCVPRHRETVQRKAGIEASAYEYRGLAR